MSSPNEYVAGGRDVRFDILKAVAIFGVVFGHVMSERGLSDNSGGRLGAFIVGLNMPLFFCISGYFSRHALEKFDALVCRVLRYLRTMAAYSALLAVVFFGLGVWDTPTLAAKRFITIPSGWWFMWVLMLAMIMTRATEALMCMCDGRLKRMRFVVALAIYLGLMAFPDSWWEMHDLKFCLPCFAVGYAIRKANALAHLHVRPCFVMWVASAIIYGVYLMWYQSFPCAFYWADFHLVSVASSWHALGAFLLRNIVACAGVLLVSLPILFLRPGRVMSVVAELGTTTMGVYFLHQCILRYLVVPYYGGGGELPFARLVVIAVVLWLICHVFVRYINTHAVLRRIFN